MRGISGNNGEITPGSEVCDHLKNVVKDTRKTIAHSTTTFSSLLGSLTAIVRDYYMTIFPKNYIKSYYISTRDFSDELEDEDVVRKNKPILSIKPKINFNGEETMLGRLTSWRYANDFIITPMRNHYGRVVYDPDRKTYIYFAHERFKMDFDIEMIFSTRLQAVNAAHYFRSTVRHRSPFYLENIWLETTLPKSMIYGIAKNFNLDINKDEDLAVLNNYLNTYSNFRITKKRSMSSGIDNYFFRFKTRLLVTFPDFPEVDDGENSGQIVSDFRMTTRMEVEFNAPNNFFLELGECIEYVDIEEEEKMQMLEPDNHITVSAAPSNVPDLIKEEVNKLVVWQGYIAESSKIDILNITDALNQELNLIIDKNNSINPKLNDEMMEVVLYKDEQKINSNNFKMDWEHKDLINKRPEKDATYYFGIYIDTNKAKDVLDRIYTNRDYIELLNKVVKG